MPILVLVWIAFEGSVLMATDCVTELVVTIGPSTLENASGLISKGVTLTGLSFAGSKLIRYFTKVTVLLPGSMYISRSIGSPTFFCSGDPIVASG